MTAPQPSVPPPSVAPPSAPAPPPPAAPVVPGAPCEACGDAFDILATSCPRCGFPRGGASPAPALRAAGKSARAAWWLSLAWPGAGHLYARDTEKGAIFTGLSALICVLSATVIGPTLGVVVWLALALYTALDAGRAVDALASGSRAR